MIDMHNGLFLLNRLAELVSIILMQIDIFNQIEMHIADTLSILVYLAYEGYVQWSHNDTVQFDVCWLQHSSDNI